MDVNIEKSKLIRLMNKKIDEFTSELDSRNRIHNYNKPERSNNQSFMIPQEIREIESEITKLKEFVGILKLSTNYSITMDVKELHELELPIL